MKTIIHPLAAILLAWSAGASETWSTSPAEAMQQAAAQNKGVMLEFTGSDWCGACIMQKSRLFPFLKSRQPFPVPLFPWNWTTHVKAAGRADKNFSGNL